MAALTDAAYWAAAEAVCTERELAALRLRDVAGLGARGVALSLGISRAAVRERLDNADRKIAAVLQPREV